MEKRGEWEALRERTRSPAQRGTAAALRSHQPARFKRPTHTPRAAGLPYSQQPFRSEGLTPLFAWVSGERFLTLAGSVSPR